MFVISFLFTDSDYLLLSLLFTSIYFFHSFLSFLTSRIDSGHLTQASIVPVT